MGSLFPLLGLNFFFWAMVGLARLCSEKFRSRSGKAALHRLASILFVLAEFIVFADLGVLAAVLSLPIDEPNIPVFTLAAAILGLLAFIGSDVLDSHRRRFNHGLRSGLADEQERAAGLSGTLAIKQNEVAAIVAAHNEERSIGRTILALKRILPAENIFIGSDASTDRTVEVAMSFGCQVANTKPNRGKAGMLVYLLSFFQIIERYKAVMIVDADAEVDVKYLERALPYFNDPAVAAIAGHGVSRWEEHSRPSWRMFFIAYRVRLWRLVQWGMRYGQTSRHLNMTYIVPGSPSMYRTSVIKHLEIDAPGLIIEDFNMTFELRHKKLGLVAYHPSIFGVHQDPHNFKDYFKQIRRWNLGFWQTYRRHGIWPSFFWLSTTAFMTELALYSLLIAALPAFFIFFILNDFVPVVIPFGGFFLTNREFGFIDVVIGIFVVDYLLTAIAAFFERKPILLIYGLGFIILRYVDAVSFLYTVPLSFIVKSTGRWVSPKRV